MMAANLPTAVWTGAFTIFGVEVKCHVLDDGRRIIDADSIGKLLAAMELPSGSVEPGDLEAFARWKRG